MSSSFDPNSALVGNKPPEEAPEKTPSKYQLLKYQLLKNGNIRTITDRVIRARTDYSVTWPIGKSWWLIHNFLCIPPEGYYPPGDPLRSQSRRFSGDLVLYYNDHEICRISAEALMDDYLMQFRSIDTSRLERINSVLSLIQSQVTDQSVLQDSLFLAQEAYREFLDYCRSHTTLKMQSPLAISPDTRLSIKYETADPDTPENGLEIEIRGLIVTQVNWSGND